MNNFFWQENNWNTVLGAHEQDRLPHALLLEGPAGLGKTLFAERLAALLLDLDPATIGSGLAHPDLSRVGVPEGKKQITVGQIRDLCTGLSMTSHGSGYKVAIIDPADKMNTSAANSLLKTLEEPTPDTMLILVRARLDTLPATIASRCQRLRFAVPSTESALEWLSGHDGTRNWRPLLEMAAGAPLAAMEAAKQGLDALDERFLGDITGIATGRLDPIAVAAEWSKLDPAVSIAWLNSQVTALIRSRSRNVAAAGEGLQILAKDLPLERIFLYLDSVQDALRRTDGALNLQMLLESLLIPWAYGLRGC